MTPIRSVTLTSVYAHAHPHPHRILYDLLRERTPEQSISHVEMPSFNAHVDFVESRPYLAWYLIMGGSDEPVGATYLTKQREIGIFIFKQYQRQGYARRAVTKMMEMHSGKFLANINPDNQASRALWENLGFNLLQETYTKTT